MALLRYWAAARAAAGTDEETVDAPTLAAALDVAGTRHGVAMARLLPSCAYLVDGSPVGRRPRESVALSADAVVEVLPPFAGG